MKTSSLTYLRSLIFAHLSSLTYLRSLIFAHLSSLTYLRSLIFAHLSSLTYLRSLIFAHLSSLTSLHSLRVTPPGPAKPHHRQLKLRQRCCAPRICHRDSRAFADKSKPSFFF